jgi:hypothetical protein
MTETNLAIDCLLDLIDRFDDGLLTTSSTGSIPFWPEPCCAVENPITTCTFLGFTVECLDLITRDTDFSAGIELAHICKSAAGHGAVARNRTTTINCERNHSPFAVPFVYFDSSCCRSYLMYGLGALSFIPTPWQWNNSLRLHVPS